MQSHAVLVDANLLLYAIDTDSRHHEPARTWLESVLNGSRRVGIPWTTAGAFVRIATHPRILDRPQSAARMCAYIDDWYARPNVWMPAATTRTWQILSTLLTPTDLSGNLVPDAMLAALADEHGLVVMTADTDFGRFPSIRWENPLLT